MRRAYKSNLKCSICKSSCLCKLYSGLTGTSPLTAANYNRPIRLICPLQVILNSALLMQGIAQQCNCLMGTMTDAAITHGAAVMVYCHLIFN